MAGSVTIVSGCPGTGKSTLARGLAAPDARGLHLVTDRFYEFPSHPIDPTRRESHAQNTAISVAAARAAGAFAEAGYRVVVDGVIGPWLLPIYTRELRASRVPVDYVVLRADLEETLRREAARGGVPGPDVVRHMHASFADLGDYERHVLDTAGRDVAEVLALVRERAARGALRLDLETG